MRLKQEKGETDDKGLSKYIKKYENMKLFIENPVPLIQMAYKNNHPPEEEIQLQVNEDQLELYRIIKKFKELTTNQ